METFTEMFNDANQFRGETLYLWSAPSARTTQSMFEDARMFDADLSNLLDVSQVTDLSLMFSQAENFVGVGT